MGYGVFYGHLKQEAKRRGCSVEEICMEAKSLGVDRLTLDVDLLPEILPLAKKTGMQFNIIYCVCRLVNGEEGDYALQAARDTAAAGGEILMLVPGFFENGLTQAAAVANAAPLMQAVVEEGARLGIDVAIEDYGGRYTPYSTIPQIQGMLEAVEGLKFVYDSGNLLYHRQDALALWDATADRIVGIHAKDLSPQPVEGTSQVLTPGGDSLTPTWYGGGLLPAAEITRRIHAMGIPPERITFEHDDGGTPDTLRFLKKSIETIAPSPERRTPWKI